MALNHYSELLNYVRSLSDTDEFINTTTQGITEDIDQGARVGQAQGLHHRRGVDHVADAEHLQDQDRHFIRLRVSLNY